MIPGTFGENKRVPESSFDGGEGPEDKGLRV